MSAKHTPGPWNDGLYHEGRDGGRFRTFVTSPDNIVPIACVPTGVEGYGREEGRANAHLIAAAPELLEACKLAIPSGVCLTNKNVADSTIVSLDCTMGDLRKIAAAIAKATPPSSGLIGEGR